MIYLSGSPRADLVERGIGYMLTPNMGNRIDLTDAVWAADTGCYSASGSSRFTVDRYIDWLAEREQWRRGCLFATAPDVFGDAVATWERSAPVLPLIRAVGYPAALVVQDGIHQLPIDWQAFDTLFIGGPNYHQRDERTFALVAEAQRRGKWVHVGRVNSLQRLRTLAVAGVDSADGTHIRFKPDKRAAEITGWLAQLHRQPALGVL